MEARTSALLLEGELSACCDADPGGVPCVSCGKSSLMHEPGRTVARLAGPLAQLDSIITVCRRYDRKLRVRKVWASNK